MRAQRLRAQLAVLAREARLLERVLDREQQLVERERLLEEVVGAELGGAHRGLDRAVAGHHHHRAARASAARSSSSTSTPSRPGMAMSSSTRSGEPSRGDRRAAPSSPSRAARGVVALVGQHARERAADALLVVDDQDRGSRAPIAASPRRGSSTMKRVPRGRFVVHADVAAVVGDDARHDREARARCRGPWSRSRARRCGGGPRRDPDAVVRDLEPHASAAAASWTRAQRDAARLGARSARALAIAAIALSIRLVSTRRICSRSRSTLGSCGIELGREARRPRCPRSSRPPRATSRFRSSGRGLRPRAGARSSRTRRPGASAPSTWLVIASTHSSSTLRVLGSPASRSAKRRRRRCAESWIGVSGFLISCAMRRATSRHAAMRCDLHDLGVVVEHHHGAERLARLVVHQRSASRAASPRRRRSGSAPGGARSRARPGAARAEARATTSSSSGRVRDLVELAGRQARARRDPEEALRGRVDRADAPLGVDRHHARADVAAARSPCSGAAARARWPSARCRRARRAGRGSSG